MINWKVRVKNKMFWVTIVPMFLLFLQVVLDIFGVKIEVSEMGEKVINLINVVFAILSALGIVIDPTTANIGDSAQAMTYLAPKNTEEGDA